MTSATIDKPQFLSPIIDTLFDDYFYCQIIEIIQSDCLFDVIRQTQGFFLYWIKN